MRRWIFPTYRLSQVHRSEPKRAQEIFPSSMLSVTVADGCASVGDVMVLQVYRNYAFIVVDHARYLPRRSSSADSLLLCNPFFLHHHHYLFSR